MMWDKLLNGIKSMYVDSSGCGKRKGGKSERFRGETGVYHVSLAVYVYMDGVMKEMKMGMGRRGVTFLEDEREWRLPGLLYADDLVLCGESEDDLKMMVGRFADVRRRRRLKVNVGKTKVMVLDGEKEL